MPHSKRGGIALLSLCLPMSAVMLVSGCTPPMPPDVLAARAEAQVVCQQGDLAVAVPEAFTGSMAAVGMALGAVCPEQTITEVAVGEPAPIQLTDVAPSSETLRAFAEEQCAGSPALTIPAFAYPVSLAYNIIGVEGLTLTPQAVAGILNGSITSFEDPLITAENDGFDLSGLPPITVLGLEGPQGSVEAMTAWLNQQDPQSWTSGVVATLPTARSLPSNLDLIAELTLAEGNVAVIPVFEAMNNVIPSASLPVTGTDEEGTAVDLVVTSDDVQLTKVGSGATTVTKDEAGNLTATAAVGGLPNPGVFDLGASKIVLAEGQPLAGWPVLGYAHLMVCDSATDPLPLSFAQYLVRLAGQGALESFGVTPMPEPIRVQTFLPLKVTLATDGPSSPSSASPSGT